MRPRASSLVLALATATVAACSAPASRERDPREAYLDDASSRRATLERSLVNPEDGYAKLRLARYASGDVWDWDQLPEWNPPTEPLDASELDAPGGVALRPLGAAARATTLAPSTDDSALRAAGEDAFYRYPVQLAPQMLTALASRANAARYGAWVDARRGVGGVVRVPLADGSTSFAFTCATCHTDARGGALVVGVGNNHLDLGALAADATPTIDPALASRLYAWGPGRVDVTTANGTEPVRIPDLRPVRLLTHLHHDATVALRDLPTLAVRLETLIITAHAQAIRPPRAVALALAAYVWSLADSLPVHAPATDAELRGAQLFRATCAGCHVPPAFTGPPVPLAAVGTDPALGLSPDRGTGMYRVPSLRGVSSRGFLLHDASAPSLDVLFDPSRTSPAFPNATRGPAAIPGHPFGLSLDDADRAALVAYLKTL